MFRRPAAVVLTALTLAACSAGSPASDGSGITASPAAPSSEGRSLSGDLAVFATASLQDTFTEFGDRLMAENPGLTVTFNFAASSTLSQQLLAGAPGDVFVAADTSTMRDAAEVTDTPVLFAHNVLEIAVPKGNPGHVTGLADFADPDLAIALCAAGTPCGSAAAKAFEAAGVTPSPDTFEKNARAALTKAVLGEVDATLVNRTDVLSAGDDVEGIDFPEAAEARHDYWIATLKDAPNPEAARAFVALVMSADSRKALADAGFEGP
jgi:molybdate transport system substrate-binding protein